MEPLESQVYYRERQVTREGAQHSTKWDSSKSRKIVPFEWEEKVAEGRQFCIERFLERCGKC
jgi:hypothetical protein